MKMAALIAEMIDRAPADHLKAMLQALANSDSALISRIHTGLEILSEYHSDNDDEDDQDDSDEPLTTSSSHSKRKRGSAGVPELDICSRPDCRQPFMPGDIDDDGTNTDVACQFHPGRLLLDEAADSWDGWLYERDGVMDSDASRESNPSGFRYECCDEPGDTEEDGCTMDRHLSSRPPKVSGGQKKQRRG
ncbi:hypothetical protein V8F06_009097 [Rhypophila decipiens]